MRIRSAIGTYGRISRTGRPRMESRTSGPGTLVVTVATFGVIGYVMERNGYPVAAMVLGIVMGTMVEQNLVTSLIKSEGSVLVMIVTMPYDA